ncbi:MAG: M15 family metallopeptidase [Treponema sp.]|nr:M15 family metallopeptidase [Treponema sp.]
MKHSWGKCILVFTTFVLQLCISAINEKKVFAESVSAASTGATSTEVTSTEVTSAEAVFRMTINRGIANLRFFQQAYPDISFSRSYDSSAEDWLITVVIPESNGKKRVASFYWAEGALLPKSELANKDKYAPILYAYPAILEDPADFSEEKKEAIRQFSSDENRKGGAGTAMFFFDAVYDASSRASLEQHLVKTTFLGKRTTVHERVKEPLARVEKRIMALSKYDRYMKEFVDELKSTDSYFWRIIAGTNRKSFHSLGIAVDVLPVSQHGKQIFWGWAKEKYPNSWMLLPLEQRWMPPVQVIRIFEEEGFIWGGKWAIYDNMHFEYRPELLQFQKH